MNDLINDLIHLIRDLAHSMNDLKHISNDLFSDPTKNGTSERHNARTPDILAWRSGTLGVLERPASKRPALASQK